MTKQEQDRLYYLANKERIKEKVKQYSLDNKDKISKSRKEKYQSNREEILENRKIKYSLRKDEINAKRRESRKMNESSRLKDNLRSKEWRELNLSKYQESQKSWKTNNLHKINFYSAKRRAAKLQATPKSWGDDELNSFIIEEAYALAKLRSGITNIKWHVDHIIPLKNNKVCGLHVYNNLRVIPEKQNLSKNNKFIL